MKFLLLSFLIFLFLIFLFGFGFLFSCIRFLFRPIRKSAAQQKNSQQTKQQTNNSKQRKIITRDKGEYVDYVEVKDQTK